jgi:hypothetical protein
LPRRLTAHQVVAHRHLLRMRSVVQRRDLLHRRPGAHQT